MPLEYRIRWRRDGRATSTAIYQSWDAAYQKYSAVLAVETMKEELYPGMPDLVEGPEVQTREVGQWVAAACQPSAVQDCEVRSVRETLQWRGNTASESGEGLEF